MRILIDECLDWRLCRFLKGYECSSVRKCGWSGTRNGSLLKLAQDKFDVFITGDLNLSFQQTISGFDISVIVLKGKSTRLQETALLMPRVISILSIIEPGQVFEVIDPGTHN